MQVPRRPGPADGPGDQAASRPATARDLPPRWSPTLRALVAATVVCFLGALLTAATLYPTYRAPDEPAHVDQVHAVHRTGTVPRLGARRLSQGIVASYGPVGYLSGVPGQAPPLAAEDAPLRGDRPPFADLGPDAPTTLPNQMAQHPPLYYVTAAAWLAVLDVRGPVAFDLEVWWLRLLGVLLAAPLPWLAARTASHLGGGPVVVAGAAVVVLAVPMLVHIGSSVNNDVLLLPLAGLATLHAAAVAGGDLSLRRALWAGLVLGLALLTKLFALALVPLTVAAAAVAWSRDRPAARAGASAATTLVAATVVGGWWWIRNVLVHGTVQPSGIPGPPPPAGFTPDVGWWLPFALGRLVRRWWIEPDTVARTTPPLIVAATVVGLVLVAAAFARARGVGRRELALLLVPVAGCLVLVLVGAWRAYARTGIPFALHGRYLYPGLLGVTVAVAVGAAASFRRQAPAVLLAGAVVLQLVAAWWTLTFSWGPADVVAPLASLRAWLAWSPVAPVWTLLPAAVAAGAGTSAAVLAWRLART